LISQAGLDHVQNPSHEERLRQYSEVSLQDELMEKGWCSMWGWVWPVRPSERNSECLGSSSLGSPEVLACVARMKSSSSSSGSVAVTGMELCHRERLSQLVEELTTSGQPQLNQDKVKELKKISKYEAPRRPLVLLICPL
ncbi:hypothetical protein XENOCAPTIV_004897, partial [Xenoophorus captivus]